MPVAAVRSLFRPRAQKVFCSAIARCNARLWKQTTGEDQSSEAQHGPAFANADA
jgi:hypothetical protein